MATRSRIGMKLDTGEILSIYCHWDGYPSNNGRLLLEHWTDPDDVRAMLALGDLSSLGSCIGEKHDFDTHYGVFDSKTGTHTPSEAQVKGWNLYYTRDRGEDTPSQMSRETIWPDTDQEYEYLFDTPNNIWLFRDRYGDEHEPFRPLCPGDCIEEGDAA